MATENPVSNAGTNRNSSRLSVSVHHVQAVLKHALRADVDPQKLLLRHRISPRILKEPLARVSVQQFADLQTNTMQAMRDEALGYAEIPLPLGSWDMMCHAVITTSTLGQALTRYCRFFQLMGRGLPIDFDLATGTISIEQYSGARGSYLPELALINTHRFACWLVQEELPLTRVRFRHSAAARAIDYKLMFVGNPVEFDQPVHSLQFPEALLDKPITQTPESLRRYLRHPTLIMLTTSYSFGWTAKIRAHLRTDLDAMPELTTVADRLSLHPQTLRRRLAEEGTTFTQIKSDIRRDTALHFLSKKSLSVEEVAFRAGFSESSAFIRAFKSWTGLTPYTYRKGLQ
ncbi:MAG: AraC family transcriptional regulator [Pseudomonadota bacterium]